MELKFDKKEISIFMGTSPYISWGLLVLISLIFTLFLNPDPATITHSYEIGDVVKKDIKAPRDFFIEDTDATKAKQQQAMDEVQTVYDYNASLAPDIIARANNAFAEMRSIIAANESPEDSPSIPASGAAEGNASKKETDLHGKLLTSKKALEDQLGTPLSDGAFSILEKEGFDQKIPALITRILSDILNNGVVANKEILLREQNKGIVLRTIGTDSETVTYNLKSYYGPDQAKTMVRIIGQPLMADENYNIKNIVVEITRSLIRPNITINRSETEKRVKSAAEKIKPVLYQIKAGEMLLREGERVTRLHLIKLKDLSEQTSKEQFFLKNAGTMLLVLCLLSIVYIVNLKRQARISRAHNKNMLFLGAVLVTFIRIASLTGSWSGYLSASGPLGESSSSIFFGIPIAAASMTVCLFMGMGVALPFALITAIFTGIILHSNFEMFIFFLLSGSMAAYWMRHCRERKVFIKSGLKIACLNLVLATAANFISGEFSGPTLLWDWTFAFAGGIVSGILTSGLAPLVEIIFDYTTDIKLLELANLDQPILRRLMLEAPGTYNHSVIVGTMSEAAASEIGANPLLAKVCGYYHDIGKLKKPLYFIENQSNGKNRHDKLAPSMSALILITHVKDGVTLAHKYKLGQAITDTIRQHHGTSLISYFYEKARQLKSEETVNQADYRYPGPIPQSREAGIVMLADIVEAASRTLENPTPARIQGLVQNMINKVFSDSQLDDCELTLKDLHSIAKSFNKILNGIYHNRIEYSESAASSNGKKKNGHTDRQQTKSVSDSDRGNSQESQSTLKRLGIS